MEEEFNNEYYIPQNYSDSGKVFRGMFNLRNLIEAIIISAILGIPEYYLIPAKPVIKITIMLTTIIPFAILALAGIDGNSLSQFALHIIHYRKQRRILHFKRIGGKKKDG